MIYQTEKPNQITSAKKLYKDALKFLSKKWVQKKKKKKLNKNDWRMCLYLIHIWVVHQKWNNSSNIFKSLNKHKIVFGIFCIYLIKLQQQNRKLDNDLSILTLNSLMQIVYNTKPLNNLEVWVMPHIWSTAMLLYKMNLAIGTMYICPYVHMLTAQRRGRARKQSQSWASLRRAVRFGWGWRWWIDKTADQQNA